MLRRKMFPTFCPCFAGPFDPPNDSPGSLVEFLKSPWADLPEQVQVSSTREGHASNEVGLGARGDFLAESRGGLFFFFWGGDVFLLRLR